MGIVKLFDDDSMQKTVRRIFIAGHQGMVGSALRRQLESQADVELIFRSREQLDLANQALVDDFFEGMNIDEVYLAAAKVGGIYANSVYPAEFAYQNLMIQSNVINAANNSGVNKLLLFGSSCIYPKLAKQPIVEETLLTGSLEPTNEFYAVAKIAGIKLCQAYNRQYGRDYRTVMPTNLYGPGDNFHPDNSHVIPALILRFHNAKLSSQNSVSIWGTGEPLREFLYVEDLASASLHIMRLDKESYDKLLGDPNVNAHINVGAGVDCKISVLANSIKRIVGYEGKIVFDATKPDGTPRKLLDVSRLTSSGWQAQVSLEQGLQQTYTWLLNNQDKLRGVA